MIDEDTYDREGEEDEKCDGGEFEEAFCLESYGGYERSFAIPVLLC